MRRRTLLASACATLTTADAGCVSSIRDLRSPSVRLGWFGVHNGDPESAHVFDLEVERDGETIHESSHEVAAAELLNPGLRMDGAVAECEWGEKAGDYTVRVRMDGEEEAERSVTEFARDTDAECVVAEAEYRNDDATSEYMSGKRLSIFLREQCDDDGYVNRCPFTTNDRE